MKDSNKNPNYWLLLGRERILPFLFTECALWWPLPAGKACVIQMARALLLSPPRQADLFFAAVLTRLPTSPQQPWFHKHYCRETNQKKKRERARWGRKMAAEARATGF